MTHLAAVLAQGDPWVSWSWVGDHGDLILSLLREHIVLTVQAVLLGLVVAIPVSLAAVQWRCLQAPAFSLAGILYTIPSLALFAILVPWTGLSHTTALIPLASYTLFILTRNIVTGLEGVPPSVKDAADGMGYGRTARLVKVEMPLALPTIMAGIRLATISTIGLVTVTALIGLGWPRPADQRRPAARLPHPARRRLGAVGAAGCSLPMSCCSACNASPHRGRGRRADVDFLGRVYDWFADGDHWSGNSGIPNRLIEHLQLTIVAMLVAIVIALPIGLILGHTRRGGNVAVNVSNIGRAIPSFALLVLGAQLWGIGEIGGMSKAALLALIALAIPPIIVNSYVGMSQVDEGIRDSAKGVGMRSSQRLLRVELPIALPLVMAGIRISALQVVATATLAAVIASGGLGRFIVDGIAVRDFPRVFAGALLVATLALTIEGVLALAQRAMVSDGLRAEGPRAVRQPGLDAPGSLLLVEAGSIPNREETP